MVHHFSVCACMRRLSSPSARLSHGPAAHTEGVAASCLPKRPRLPAQRAGPPPLLPQAYVDDHLLCELPGGGRLQHAAILGQDGGVWAQSEHFPAITPDEVAALVKGLTDSAQLAQSGIRIAGEKYMMVAGEPGEVIRGKKGAGGRRRAAGCCSSSWEYRVPWANLFSQ